MTPRKVLTGLWLVVLMPAVAAQFVVPEGSHYHNGSSLPQQDDGSARTLLSRLEQALVLGDAEEADFVMRTLRTEVGSTLVPFGRRTHLPAIDLGARMVAGSGLPGLIGSVERDNERAFRTAREVRDTDALIDLATRGMALESSRAAALAAARLEFERGEWWAAAALASRLGEPGAELAAAAQARLDQALGLGPPRPDPIGPWTWTHAFPRRLWPNPPFHSSPAVLGGREDELLILDGLGLLGIRFDLVPGAVPSSPNWRRVRLADGDQGWVEQTLGDQPWMISSLLIPQGFGPPAPRRFSAAKAGARMVVPFNVLQGGYSYPGHQFPREAHLLGIEPATGGRPTWVASLGAEGEESTAFGPATIDGDRVFLQLFRPGLPSQVSLVGVRLTDGEILFETPLVRGDHVDRFSSRRAETDPYFFDKRSREGAVAVRDGIVYACTGYGVVAAVDGLTGRVRHTFHYDRLFSLDPEVYDPAMLFDTGGWDHEPVRLFGDRVVVAPSDSRYLYVLAAEPGPEGQQILDDPIERLDRRHIVALRPDPDGSASPMKILSRIRDDRFGLVAIGPDGHVRQASERLPASERVDSAWMGRPDVVSRPAVSGDCAYVPTSRGVRAYSLADLERPSELLDRPEGWPAPMSVHVTTEGLVALTPVWSDRQMYVECWKGRP